MKTLTFLIATALVVPAQALLAQDQQRTQTQDRIQTQDQARQTPGDQEIYGYQLMSPAERNEYRDRMHAAQNAEEREQIRAEHHAQMQKRAQARGMTLPDAPPAVGGGGMGPGRGAGPGGVGAGGTTGPRGGGMGSGMMGPGGGMGGGYQGGR